MDRGRIDFREEGIAYMRLAKPPTKPPRNRDQERLDHFASIALKELLKLDAYAFSPLRAAEMAAEVASVVRQEVDKELDRD
jgi:hypothetical protein